MMGTFKKFKDPSQGGKKLLVNAVGADYICGGCGDPLPGGAWLFETVEGDMIVGIVARNGSPDAPIVHECGDN